MLLTAPLVIAYALWVIFVLAWNVFDRSAATIAAPGARRERLYGVVIALGLVMIVVAPVTVGAGRIWVNPPILDWAMLLVMMGGIAWCWWARLHLGRFWSSAGRARRFTYERNPQGRALSSSTCRRHGESAAGRCFSDPACSL